MVLVIQRLQRIKPIRALVMPEAMPVRLTSVTQISRDAIMYFLESSSVVRYAEHKSCVYTQLLGDQFVIPDHRLG